MPGPLAAHREVVRRLRNHVECLATERISRVMTMGSHDNPEPSGLRTGSLRMLTHSLAVGTLAGLLAGCVTGVGARIAMRISGLAAGIEKAGASTEAGFTVGEITVGGIVGLCLFSAFFGIFGGLAYQALRPWLPESRLRRELALGILLLTMFGPLVIESVNPDFRGLGPPLLNICSFASLFLLFGAVLPPIADRLDRPARKVAWARIVGRWTLSLLGILAVVPMMFLILRVFKPPSPFVGVPAKSLAKELIGGVFHPFGFGNIVISTEQGLAILVLLYVLVVVPAVSVLLRRNLAATGQPSDLPKRKWGGVLMYSVLGVPVIAGLLLNYVAIVRILEGAG